MKRTIISYGMVFAALGCIDRLTKMCALLYCQQAVTITPFLACEMMMNRGVAWSILHSESVWMFGIASGGALAMTIACCWYAREMWRSQQSLWGIGMVLVGAVSNLADRWWYGGVIDFIVVHYHDWVWPVFNVADALICVGVGIVILQQMRFDNDI